jgi:hypothetical protein
MRPHAVYARAKLAFGVLLREFGRRTPGVTVADFHPGIIASDFGRYMGVSGAVLTRLARPFLDTPSSLAQEVGLGLGAQAGEARLGQVMSDAGYSHFRRATETPMNLVLEARP